MEKSALHEAHQDVLDNVGEWPVKVIRESIEDDNFVPHEWMAPNSGFEQMTTQAERRTPLPIDAGTEAGYCLPGEGAESIKLDCGQVYAILWCDTCSPDKKEWAGEKSKSCTNRLCPECYAHWLHRQSEKLSDRLYQFRREVGYSGRHIVISPSEEDRFKPIKWLRQMCYQLSDELGIIASMVVLHLWRFRNLEGREVPWKFCSLNPSAQSNIDHINSEYEKKATDRPSPVDSPIPCRRFYWPHFHMIAWGWLMDSNDFHEISEGWIYKNLDDGSKGRVTRQDFYRTVRYMLSHSAIKPRSMTYVYRGYLHYTKWDLVQEWTEDEIEKCPKCDSDLVQIHLKNDGGLGREVTATVTTTLRLFDWTSGEPPPGLSEKFRPP